MESDFKLARPQNLMSITFELSFQLVEADARFRLDREPNRGFKGVAVNHFEGQRQPPVMLCATQLVLELLMQCVQPSPSAASLEPMRIQIASQAA
jgi:hypothetical protein